MSHTTRHNIKTAKGTYRVDVTLVQAHACAFDEYFVTAYIEGNDYTVEMPAPPFATDEAIAREGLNEILKANKII